jgi:hypothetical protein
MKRLSASLLILLVAAGCLRALHPAASCPEGDLLLAAGIWRPEGRLLLRQSALVTLGDRSLPLDGVLELDPSRGSARLVAIDPMGIKLFDITVRRDAAPESRGTPPPGVAGAIPAVSESLRRIYLLLPSGAASELRDEGDARVVRVVGESLRETWVFDGLTGRLRARVVKGRGSDWEVSYGPPTFFGGVGVPGEIILHDRKAGYRLTIRSIEVMRGDE